MTYRITALTQSTRAIARKMEVTHKETADMVEVARRAEGYVVLRAEDG